MIPRTRECLINKVIKIFVCIAILFVSVSHADSSRDQECKYSGEWEIFTPETVLFTKCGEDNIRVKIGLYEVDQNKADHEFQSRVKSVCPGYSQRYCRTLVKYIEIIFNNKSFFVDDSAFYNIYNLHGAEIRKEKDRYNLIFNGGTEVVHYYVKLNFSENGADDHVSIYPESFRKLRLDILSYMRSVDLWKTEQLAQQGEVNAQYRLALRYYYGESVYQDFEKSAKWFRKAAEQGHTISQYNLGDMLIEGEVVMQDLAEAAYWFHKAAEKGHAKAQYSLGFMHWEGLWVVQDPVKALMWANLAEEKGVVAAIGMKMHILNELKPSQIEEAQKLTEEWRKKHDQ